MNKKNALGFFFDASLDGYKYGLNIYNPDANGMNKIREYILDNKHYAKRVIEDFNEACLLEIQGEKYNCVIIYYKFFFPLFLPLREFET